MPIVFDMASKSQQISFETLTDMTRHLDRWAATSLDGPAGWEDAIIGSQAWLDYSARNQVLLASYGIAGVVAGTETWRLVPSTHEGKACAVRAGEHGYPVRVPVTTGGNEPDPYLGGIRPTRAAVERWEWRRVFAVEQLARRPAHDAMEAADLPAVLLGPAKEPEFLAAVRKVASATVRGRLARSSDPHRVLADAAVRLRRSARRPELEPTLAEQVAWLVADRVGLAYTDRPARFDPSRLEPRERWERLQDVLDPARKLVAALGVTVGVDLTASPLPRMEIVDDRVVPAGRRHRLPAASFEQLPVGRWITVGPYTTPEWAARGETASGQGAYLRLNKTAYLVAVELGDSASWRLEDVASRTGDGLLATGNAPNLERARDTAVKAMRSRYPALVPAEPDLTVGSPGGTAPAWEPMPGKGRSSAQLRQFSDQITLYVIPGPGGRWMPAIQQSAGRPVDRLPLVKTIEEARDAAELAGHRALRTAAIANPVTFDATVDQFARSGEYRRSELIDIIGSRLESADRLAMGDADGSQLAEVLGATGLAPATIVSVLHAERLDADTVARLLPTIGVPMPDAIRVLHHRWGIEQRVAATLLDATAAEMRDAGCSPVEIMAARPREILRALPQEPHLWELAAGTMAAAGHSPSVIAAHIVAHAPNLDTFAAALTTAIDDPTTGLSVAVAQRATGEQLAVASEAYGLAPDHTAHLLIALGASPLIVLDTLAARCEHDIDAAADLATAAGIDGPLIASWRDPIPAAVAGMDSRFDLSNAGSLLTVLPPPRVSPDIRTASGIDGLQSLALEATSL